MALKVTFVPADIANDTPPCAVIELTPEAATMLQEMASKSAAPGAQARVLADLYDAAGIAAALLGPPKG